MDGTEFYMAAWRLESAALESDSTGDWLALLQWLTSQAEEVRASGNTSLERDLLESMEHALEHYRLAVTKCWE